MTARKTVKKGSKGQRISSFKLSKEAKNKKPCRIEKNSTRQRNYRHPMTVFQMYHFFDYCQNEIEFKSAFFCDKMHNPLI